MPIKEESFRIGCGRYIQGKEYTSKLAEEVLRLGSSPLIVGGTTALTLTKKQIERNVKNKCATYKIITHSGTCNEERAKQLAQYALENSLDVIVGVGGGVVCDFAKLIGHFAKLPVICLPTSSATCAAYTPLSIRYTVDGKTVGSLHYGYEVNCVIADTDIIGQQPVRLFLAGVFDALSKFVEIKQRFNENITEFPIGLDYAYVLAKYSYEWLVKNVNQCLNDMENKIVSDVLEKAIFSCIAATGVVSGIASCSNQTALAHKFYETTRFLFPETAKPYLHGEIVGVGLILQNKFNGQQENNAALIKLMQSYDMPCKIEDVGIEKSQKVKEDYYEKLVKSTAINENDELECENLKNSLDYLWSI